MRITFLFLAVALLCGAQSASEVSATPAVAVFKSSTSLVQVPVVVRDSKGQAIGTLKAEDFQLFDNGKPQIISKFSVEKFETTAAARNAAPSAELKPAQTADDIKVPALPDRFVAYYFDDVHMGPAHLKYTRDAATKQLDELDFSHQRAAVFTSSGRVQQEFTSNLDSLHAALAKISTGWAAAERAMGQDCPPMGYYMADLIYNRHDPSAKTVAIQEAMQKCQFKPDVAERAVENAARAAVLNGEMSTQAVIDNGLAIVNRMAALPGQRHLVLISPGFLVLENKQPQLTGLIDRALKANVVIGGLDARGLYTTSMDASERDTPNPMKQTILRTESMVMSDGIANLADGTGGIFYHGTNDYNEGFAKVATAPEYIYMLAFSPTALKPDGKSHKLKVTLVNGRGLTVTARSSYFADARPEDPMDQIRQQVQDAFFSNTESQALPARLQAEFFKDGDNATLTANVRVDATKLPFKKEEGRNRDNLTLVIGIFDQNGNFVSAFEKTIELRLKDETLSAWLKAGITNSTDFNVKPGKYLVRLVVRDSEGSSMAQTSTGVDIPW